MEEEKGTAGIQYSRWHGVGTRGKIREGERRKKKEMEILDVSPSTLSGKRRGGFLSVIKLNRNLISMGNVSTNRLGKDLCEWGEHDCTLLDDARLMGWLTNGKG